VLFLKKRAKNTMITAAKIDGMIQTANLSRAASSAKELEDMGYDGGLTAEMAHDPFFPILLAATGISLWRRRPWGFGERTVAVMLFTVLWVLALVLFVDGPEGNRVRFSTEPYLLLMAGWTASAFLDFRHERRLAAR